jgi:hypothetical protein
VQPTSQPAAQGAGGAATAAETAPQSPAGGTAGNGQTAPAAGAGQPAQPQTPAPENQAGAAPASGEAAQGKEEGSSESEQVLKNQEKPPEQETNLSSLGINLISNKFTIELTQSYVHSTTNQLFIEGFGVIPILVVGNVTVQQVRKDIFILTTALRYKVTDRLQAETRLPFEYMIIRQSEPAGLAANAVVSPSQDKLGYENGLGDVTFGLNYSIKDEGLNSPALLAGLTFKGRNGRDIFDSPDPALHPPIGSGFFSLGGTLSASKTSAPAIVFGSVGYSHAFPRHNVVFIPTNGPATATLIDFNPGDNFNLSMGLAISLNYNFTLNMSYAQSVNFSSKINGRTLGNSATDAITLRLGGTWRFSTKTSADVGISFGVTPDAPDFRLDIRLPWKFGNA